LSLRRLLALILPAAAVLALVSPAVARDGVAEAEAPAIQIRAFTLESGLKIVLARTPTAPGQRPSVYVGAYAGFGQNDEPAVGVAHFVEHIAGNSAPGVAAPPDRPGTEWLNGNAMTKANHLVYLTLVSPEGLEQATFMRLATLGALRVARSTVEAQRARVLDELRQGQSWAAWSAYKAADALATGSPPALAVELTTVEQATPESLAALLRRTHQPSTGVLVLAGDLDLDEAEAIARRSAAALGLDAPRPPAEALPARTPVEQGSALLAEGRPGSFTAGAAYAQPDHLQPDFPAFMVLDQLLLGGQDNASDPEDNRRSDASVLGRRLSARLGASGLWDGKVKGAGVPMAAEGDPSRYVIVFSLPGVETPGRVAEVLHASLVDIRREELSETGIVAARTALAAYYRRAFEDPSHRFLADHLARYVRDGRDPADVLKLPELIEGVDVQAVRGMLDRTLLAQTPAVAVIVPAAEPPATPVAP